MTQQYYVARLFDDKGRVLISPNGFKSAANCWRDWNETYPRNNRDRAPSRGTSLGAMVHRRVEAYAKGRTVYRPEFDAEDIEEFRIAQEAGLNVEAWLDDSLPIAQALLPYLPDPLAIIEAESPCDYPVDEIYGRRWTVNPRSSKDLKVRMTDGTVGIIDIKTTVGGYVKGKRDPWLYVPPEDMLRKDPQSVIYALDVMRETGQDYVDCCWMYVSTRGTPKVKPIWFRMHKEQATEEFEKRWLPLGDAMAEVILQAREHGPAPSDLMPAPKIMPFEESPCSNYNICSRHVFKGGDCDPGHTMGVLSDYLNRKKRKR